MDWMHLKQNKDPVDYDYKIVDLRFSPSVWLKAFIIEKLPVGTRYYGRMTIDKLERVRSKMLSKYPAREVLTANLAFVF
jgi:hypothetical protein